MARRYEEAPTPLIWNACKHPPTPQQSGYAEDSLVERRELHDSLYVFTAKTINSSVRWRLIRCNVDKCFRIEKEGFGKA